MRRYGVPLEAVLDGLRRQAAARRHGRPAERLGRLLVERQQLVPEILRRALGESVCRVAGPVLLWDSGSFAFWTDPSPMVPQAFSGQGARAPRSSGTRAAEPDECAPQVSLEELVLRRWSGPEGSAAEGSAPDAGTP